MTTNSRHENPFAPHLWQRAFTATEPNKKWGTAIPDLPTGRGWLYLAVVLDVSSRLGVGWSLSAHCDADLAENALPLAPARRRPCPGLLHQSDRGSQYTSQAYRQLVEQYGMIVSMSRQGKCWDNAAMESFFGSLKEWVGGPMKRPGLRSPLTWKSFITVFAVIGRSDTSVLSSRNTGGNQTLQLFDVIQFTALLEELKRSVTYKHFFWGLVQPVGLSMIMGQGQFF